MSDHESGRPEWLRTFEQRLERLGPTKAEKVMKETIKGLSFERRMELIEWWASEKLEP